MASPKMLELEMQKQLLRKNGLKILPREPGLNRATRRTFSRAIGRIPQKQVDALLKVAVAKGVLKEEDLKAPE